MAKSITQILSLDNIDESQISHNLYLLVAGMGILVSVFIGVTMFILKLYLPFFIMLVSTLVYITTFVGFYNTQNLKLYTRINVYTIYANVFSLHVVMGGFIPSGGLMMWGIIPLIGELGITRDMKQATIWFFLYTILIFSGIVFYKDIASFTPDMPLEVTTTLLVINISGVSILIFVSLRSFVALNERMKKQLDQKHVELKQEQEKSERLLLNILPGSIAQKLKQETSYIADGFQDVSVLFADIVGFTKLSENVTPHELVNLLNDIFSRFDRLAEIHGLEKIKTIGDAYMVAGGLPEPRDGHLLSITEMALDMLKEVDNFCQEQQVQLQTRIGINSGPVVAGVIGQKKFIYDLWGDTVNLASRMESNGIPQRIQVTQMVYDQLKDHYQFELREQLVIKGKGKLDAYLLEENKKNRLNQLN